MEYIDKGAKISADGRYRYLLWREWRGTHARRNWRWFGLDGVGNEMGEPKACVFIMLNPSTADGNLDDPTIRRCVGFAASLNYERLEVVNLFAHRATDPKALLALQHTDDPVGVENQRYIERATSDAGIVIAAWGAHGAHLGQDETVRGWVCHDGPLYCLGKTAKGFPRHPLYLPANASLVRL